MAADALANPAPDPLFASFSDKVREFSLRFGADLTPNRAASIVGSSATSDAPGRWSIKLQHESEVIMKAESADAQVRWLAFMLSREFGLILEQLLPIYGDQYQALEGQKDGTDIFYESPKAGSVVPGTRIAVRLWTRDAAPRSEVIKLNLQRPDE